MWATRQLFGDGYICNQRSMVRGKLLGYTRGMAVTVARISGVMIGLFLLLGTFAAQQKMPAESAHESRYRYDTDGVQLQGTLVKRTYYGPPGFGETPAQDTREAVLVLRLTQPITVEPTLDAHARGSENLDTRRHITEIQLFILPLERTEEARKMLGKTVVAMGTLREAIAPGQHTDVTMNVKSLKLR